MLVCKEATDDLVAVLRRCRTVLGNMAEENPGLWNELIGRRWPINHEPLRSDAKNLVLIIDDVLESVDV